MNWYRVLTPHDNFAMGDIVLLPGDAREAALEQMGYLRFVREERPGDRDVAPQQPQVKPEFLALEPDTKKAATTPKRGRSGKQVETEQVSGEEHPDAGGESVRAGHLPTD